MTDIFWNRLRVVLLAGFLCGLDDVRRVRFSKRTCRVVVCMARVKCGAVISNKILSCRANRWAGRSLGANWMA